MAAFGTIKGDKVVDVHDNGTKTKENCKRLHISYKQHLVVFASLLVALLIVIIVWMIVVFIKHAGVTNYNYNYFIQTVPKSTTTGPINTTFVTEEASGTTELTDTNHTTPSTPKIFISRKEWKAQAPSGRLDSIDRPIPSVIIQHTVMRRCSDFASCSEGVRFIQSFHMEDNEWFDIGYNFLVGGDGNAYEGRGWEAMGAHTGGFNRQSIGIGFMGTFNDVLPPERQIEAAQKLMEWGVQLGHLDKDYKLFAARQLKNDTESPGLMLYENMKTWPHWTRLL